MTTIHRTKVIKEEYEYHLTEEDIKNLILEKSPDLDPKNIKSFSVYVMIPGGGDWSNTNLDIHRDCPLVVKFKQEHDEIDSQ